LANTVVLDLKRTLSVGIAIVIRSLERWTATVLRERDLLLRSDGRVHFVRLTTRLQLVMVLVAVSVLLWVGGTSYTAWDQRNAIRSGLDELREIKATYRDLLGEASAYNTNISTISKRLAVQQGNLDQLVSKLDQTGGAASLALPEDGLDENLRRLGVGVSEMSAMTALVGDSLAKSKAEFARVDGVGRGAIGLRRLLRDRLRVIDDKLSETQSELAQKENVRASLKESLNVANAELIRLKNAREELKSNIAAVVQEREEERERGDKLSTEIVRMSETLLAVKNKHEGAIRQRSASEARMAALDNLLNGSRTHNQRLETQLSGVLDQLALQAGREDEQGSVAKIPVSERVAQLLKRLEGVYSSEEATLTLYSQHAAAGRADIERIISKTGLDAATLMNRVENIPSGQGGIFIAVASKQEVSGRAVDAEREGLASVLSSLDGHLARWESLREIMRVLPLVTPVDNYHVSSGYGVRKDPITKRKAMHRGADLAGWPRSPVYASARGTVAVAGRKAGFGKMVEINHGYRIRTRYGHLEKILVKKGQVIDFRHKIGLLGNTGRSTGPHVHYEILFDGKQMDPIKFIEAGRYVSKE
jgi:murein DD-endopeptidase MepM/ murein hydrolase activator NlpD